MSGIRNAYSEDPLKLCGYVYLKAWVGKKTPTFEKELLDGQVKQNTVKSSSSTYVQD